jgi:hypothetical protein
MGTEAEHQHAHTQPAQHAFRPPPRGDSGGAKVTHKLDETAAWPRVDAVLKGNKKDLAQLPLLVTFLGRDKQNELWLERNAELMKLGGNHVLDVMRALGHTPHNVTDFALKATPKVSADKLRAYLRTLDGAALAEVETYSGIRTVLKGKLLEELPMIASSIEFIGGSRQLVRWLADTTEPALLASMFAEQPTAALARTLDAEKLWAWLDHLTGARGYGGLTRLAEATSDPAIKQKIITMLGPFAGEDYDAIAKARDASRDELRAAIDENEKVERAKLMEMIGGAGTTLKQLPLERLVLLFRRAKLSADDVVSALVGNIEVQKGLPILLDTEGVTKSHVIRYAAGQLDMLQVLRDEKLRKRIRGKLGSTIGMRDLLRWIDHTTQRALLEDEALRSWYIADATPEDLLAMCGGSSDHAARMFRLVKRARGTEWVYQLSPGANKVAMRVLATNCGDAKVAAFIRDTLIADEPPNTSGHIGAVATDPAAYGGEKERLADAENAHDHAGVLARLADMDDQQRAQLAQDRTSLSRLFKKIDREDRLRALSLLDLPFAETVTFATPDTGFDRQLVLHLRTRSVAEEKDVLTSPVLVKRASDHVHPDPLQTFPSLREPKVLANAIALVPELVERMLTGTESSRALRLLGHPYVRKSFEAALEASPELVELIPRYDRLDATAQKRIDQIGNEINARGPAGASIAELQDGDHEVDPRRDAAAAIQQRARDKADVSEAIKVLANEGGETSGAMALIAEHHDAIVAMLDDASKWPVIQQLARLVDLPPSEVFEVGPDRLLLMSNVRRWLFAVTPGFVLLHELRAARAPVLSAVATDIDHDMPGAVDWLTRLPVGAGLTDREEMTLDTLQLQLTNERPLQALFKTRFGITPPTLDARGLKTTYQTLARLPDAHVQQERIKEIKHEDVGDVKKGYWRDGAGEIMIAEKVIPGGDTETMSPRSGLMTREQVRKAYGWDDATIDGRVADGRLEERIQAGQKMYELPDVKLDGYTQVLLHEIGHSVDSILGERTAVIFDLAGWRLFDEGDFERWAAEMGGWDKVAAPDQKRVRQAWLDALKSKQSVASIIDKDHPAQAKKYEGVAIVDAVRQGVSGMYGGAITANGRAFFMQPYYGHFYSLKAEAASNAPSAYSLFAPQEYFAECYVEYYRLVDGTPKGNKLKGGMLPAPIKEWFDTHVDNVRFDPKRLTKNSDAA